MKRDLLCADPDKRRELSFMKKTDKKVMALLTGILLILAFSGCGNDSQNQAECCLEALSAVQSADSMYARIEVTEQENDEKSEVYNNEEYWKDGENILYYIAFPDDEYGGKLWYLYYDGIWYTQYTYEVDNEEADVWGYDWTEADGSPNSTAFWQNITQTAEELTLISEEEEEELSILTFQAALSDEEVWISEEIRLAGHQYVFTLDKDGNLKGLENRYISTDNSSGTERVTQVWNVSFADTENCREIIEAEAQKIQSE